MVSSCCSLGRYNLPNTESRTHLKRFCDISDDSDAGYTDWAGWESNEFDSFISCSIDRGGLSTLRDQPRDIAPLRESA